MECRPNDREALRNKRMKMFNDKVVRNPHKFLLDPPEALGENPPTVRFDETEHGLSPWRARRCIRGRKLHGLHMQTSH